jgi:hypothetical protein
MNYQTIILWVFGILAALIITLIIGIAIGKSLKILRGNSIVSEIMLNEKRRRFWERNK